MTIQNLVVGQSVPITSLTPVDSAGKPTAAVVGTTTYTSSDITIFTVEPNGTCVAVGAGSATLGISSSVTEPDGTVHTVPGSATIVVAAKPAVTAAVVPNFGTPTTSVPTPVPNPTGTAH